MPTVKQLQDMASKKGIEGYSKMNKAMLLKILGFEVVDKYDTATDIYDIKSMKFYKSEEGKVFKKIWEHEEKNLYLAVLQHDNDSGGTMFLKMFSSGNGLGRGGAKWYADTAML
jgi:hypothetical protein